jgi:LuxR family maltose regulon positive regulatory protein
VAGHVRAARLLERLFSAAQDGGRGGSVLEILIVRALALQARGDAASALTGLERAVTLARPEGYVRLFAEEGAPMAALLKALTRQSAAPGYVRRLSRRRRGPRPTTPAGRQPWSTR